MRKEIIEVVQMAKRDGIKVNFTKIGRIYNCDPRTVKRYYERDETSLIRKKRVVKKVTDGLDEVIKKKTLEDKASAIAIFYFLKEHYNYVGSYSTIKDRVHKINENINNDIRIRFETVPGLQGQIDWKESFRIFNRQGDEFCINIFLSILGYSRKKYIELTLDREQITLFNCLTHMFTFFGGVPQELLFDNMKTVVDRPRSQFNNVVLNKKFYAFSKDAGFIPKTCMPYSPWTKGKVEVLAKLMDRLKVYNHEFDTIEELNTIVKKLQDQLNEEISNTTKEKPNTRFVKEKEYLRPLPNLEILEDYLSDSHQSRKVSKDSMIEFKGNKYSVPRKYTNKTVNLKLNNDKLEIYFKNELIRIHTISNKPLNYNPLDYADILSHSNVSIENIEELCKTNLENLDKIFGG